MEARGRHMILKVILGSGLRWVRVVVWASVTGGNLLTQGDKLQPAPHSERRTLCTRIRLVGVEPLSLSRHLFTGCVWSGLLVGANCNHWRCGHSLANARGVWSHQKTHVGFLRKLFFVSASDAWACPQQELGSSSMECDCERKKVISASQCNAAVRGGKAALTP
eukprot:1843797-Amphidinium_carterae.1